MQKVAVLCVLAVAFVGSAIGKPQDRDARVSSTLDSLRSPLTDIPLAEMFAAMNNRNNLEFYVNCVTGKETCNSIGRAMQSLILDVQSGGGICKGCSKCEFERVEYMMNTLRDNHKDLACQIQEFLKRPVFAGTNPCA